MCIKNINYCNDILNVNSIYCNKMGEYGIIPSIYYILLSLQAISCLPIDNAISADAHNNPGLRDEIHYPNGTVVGRYSYKDDEGNPIAVKYFADRHSYGVELNSFKTMKVVDSSNMKEVQHKPKFSHENTNPLEPLIDLASEIMRFHGKIKAPADVEPKKDMFKIDHLTEHTGKLDRLGTPDYETFYQNDVKAPKQCEKDKVRVYLVKEKRKVRSALKEDQTAKYCERL